MFLSTKTISLLLSILAVQFFGICSGIAIAQTQLSNGGFESWQNAGTGEDPVDWGSRNQQSQIGYPVLITKTTDAYAGSYALKLVSDSATVPPPAGSGTLDTLSGVLWLNGVFSGGPPTGGIAFTDRPDSIRGFVKCNTGGGDKIGRAHV